jgi:hypothetical protein
MDDVRIIRVHTTWISYFTFIGQTENLGFRLAFAPMSPKNLMNTIRERFPAIGVDVYNTYDDPNENDDRKRFNLPPRPSG